MVYILQEFSTNPDTSCIMVIQDCLLACWQRKPLKTWRHQKEAFSALLAICVGNSPVTDEFPAQRPVTRSFDAFFDLRLNKGLSKQSCGWWFETPSHPLWRNFYGTLHWLIFCLSDLGPSIWIAGVAHPLVNTSYPSDAYMIQSTRLLFTVSYHLFR